MNFEEQRISALKIIKETNNQFNLYNTSIISGRNDIQQLQEYFEKYNLKHNYTLISISSTGSVLKKDRLIERVYSNLMKLVPEQFEKLSAQLVRYLGFEDYYKGTKKSWDEGVDFFAYKNSEKYKGDDHKEVVFGQCKMKIGNHVNVQEIRELAGAVSLFQKGEFASANTYKQYRTIGQKVKSYTPLHVFFISSYFFSTGAKSLCKKTNIIPFNIIDIVYQIHKAINDDFFDWKYPHGRFKYTKFITDINNVEIEK